MRAIRRATSVAFAMLALLVLVGFAGAQEVATIAFTDDSALTATIKDGTGEIAISVVNPGDATGIDWSVQLAPGANGAARTASVEPDHSTLDPRNVTPVSLTIGSVSTTGKLSGLLVGIPESGRPITRALTISNFGVSLPLEPAVAVLIVFALSGIILLIRMATLGEPYDKPIINPKWDYASTWTATFTGVGALLATIVASGALPEEPYLLDKATFAALGILFGALGLLAPVIFSALNNLKRVNALLLFHFTTWISTSAVIGQLLTIFLLLIDASGQGTDSWFVRAVILIEVLAILATYTYIFRGVPKTLDAAQSATDADSKKATTEVEVGPRAGLEDMREAPQAVVVTVPAPAPTTWTML